MKRLIIIIIPIVLLGAISGAVVARASQMTTAGKHGRTVLATVATYESDGIPATELSPVAAQAHKDVAATKDSVFTATWWTSDAPSNVVRLSSELTTMWNKAVGVARSQAQSEISTLQTLTSKDAKWLPTSPPPPSPAAWSGELTKATTPKSIVSLQLEWTQTVSTLQTTVTTTQRQDALASQEGSSGLLGEATILLDDAASDGLNPGDLSTLASEYKSEIVNGQNTSVTSAQLLTAEQSLQQTVAENNTLYTVNRTLELSANQALAEGTSSAAAEWAAYSSLSAQYAAASTLAELQALALQYTTEQAAVNSDLSAHTCGYTNMPAGGWEITISLSLQEMIVYENQCVVLATPVTTGRPGDRTPTCTCHIYDKISPFEMISQDPESSPNWYPPTWVTWVMGIEGPGMSAGEGYFIHDAYWEPTSEFGPNGQNGAEASHGCIHTPHDAMEWAYANVPIGTPVNIVN